MGMLDSPDRMRYMSDSADISWEKKAVGCLLLAALQANWSPSAVLPMPGLAAMIIISDGCQPLVTESRGLSPQWIPCGLPPDRICSMTS